MAGEKHMTYQERAKAAFRRGDVDSVEVMSRQELARARTRHDAQAEVEALCMLARVALRTGDIAAAKRLGSQALERARASGQRRLEQAPVHIVAGCARMAGDTEAARAAYGASIALNQELGSEDFLAMERHNLAYLELRAGDPARAAELFGLSRAHVVKGTSAHMHLCAALATAVLAEARGDFRDAARRLGTVEGWLAANQQILDPDDEEERLALRDRLTTRLDSAAFDALREKGALLTPLALLTAPEGGDARGPA
jgi:ATP/maltotriose-dependent transcriptional regulator MalT